MEGANIAHDLPDLYRSVLERVVSLEHTGRRGEALMIRRAAVAAYSRAWDDRATKRLEALRSRAERVLDGFERARAVPPRRSDRPALRWSRSG